MCGKHFCMKLARLGRDRAHPQPDRGACPGVPRTPRVEPLNSHTHFPATFVPSTICTATDQTARFNLSKTRYTSRGWTLNSQTPTYFTYVTNKRVDFITGGKYPFLKLARLGRDRVHSQPDRGACPEHNLHRKRPNGALQPVNNALHHRDWTLNSQTPGRDRVHPQPHRGAGPVRRARAALEPQTLRLHARIRHHVSRTPAP